DLLKRVKTWLNDLWDISPDNVKDDGVRISDKSKLVEQNLSDNTRLILGWLRQHKSDGSWLKYRGKEGRDGNFINFLSDKGINRKLRDAAIEELETAGLIEVDDEKGIRLVGFENNQV
ncbi:hypothetical protein, partial [Staphylococcus aureus]|uniref:hypothetical protein n=1 Tax=Staphylococcus aureus TaxID=1280 RepID=UPI0018A23E90